LLLVAQKFEGGSPLERVDKHGHAHQVPLPSNPVGIVVDRARMWVALPDRLVQLCNAAEVAASAAAAPAEGPVGSAALRSIDLSAETRG
jgi:hypothetical protein